MIGSDSCEKGVNQRTKDGSKANLTTNIDTTFDFLETYSYRLEYLVLDVTFEVDRKDRPSLLPGIGRLGAALVTVMI